MSSAHPAHTADGHAAIEFGDAFARLKPAASPPGLAQIGTGHALYAAFNWVFDNVLYVWVIYTLGMLKGGALMMAASGLQCALTLLVYQRMRVDWVGTGLLAEIRTKPEPTRLERALIWASNRHPAIVFILLCVFQDPFITTAWFKQGSFDRLGRRDWALFTAAVIVSNLYWICLASLIGQALVTAYQIFIAPWT